MISKDSCGSNGNILYRMDIDDNSVSTTFTYNTLGHTFKRKLHLDGVDDIDEAERMVHNVYMNTCPDKLYERE